MDAYDQIAEVLFPSYEYLPQYLKMFFLYLGAFPPYHNLLLNSGLISCISAEGFLPPSANPFLEQFELENFVSMPGGACQNFQSSYMES